MGVHHSSGNLVDFLDIGVATDKMDEAFPYERMLSRCPLREQKLQEFVEFMIEIQQVLSEGLPFILGLGRDLEDFLNLVTRDQHLPRIDLRNLSFHLNARFFQPQNVAFYPLSRHGKTAEWFLAKTRKPAQNIRCSEAG